MESIMILAMIIRTTICGGLPEYYTAMAFPWAIENEQSLFFVDGKRAEAGFVWFALPSSRVSDLALRVTQPRNGLRSLILRTGGKLYLFVIIPPKLQFEFEVLFTPSRTDNISLVVNDGFQREVQIQVMALPRVERMAPHGYQHHFTVGREFVSWGGIKVGKK